MRRDVRVRLILAGLFGITLALGSAAPAHAEAEGFISPLIGYNFGGDATCPAITGCEDKRLNVGVSLGVMGNVLGFEEEFAYAKDFFGSALGLNSSVLTVMTNVMLVPKIGPVRPYVAAGVGLIKTHVELTPTSIFTSDNNNFGWDVGGGLIIKFAPHVGVRGDLRYFHAFQDLSVLGFTLKDTKLDFGRAAAALMLTW
jgi:opacity protein-like surface antigen